MKKPPERSRPSRRPPGTRQLGTLLRDPALAINELVSDALTARGFPDFRPAHGAIGQYIADGGSRITELAEIAQLTKPTVVYLVNDLEALGYVERVPDPADGRAKLVRLTVRGLRAQNAGREVVTQIERDWSRALGQGAYRELRGHLEQLHDLLWPPPGQEPASE